MLYTTGIITQALLIGRSTSKLDKVGVVVLVPLYQDITPFYLLAGARTMVHVARWNVLPQTF